MKCRAIFNASPHVFKISNLYHFGTEISRNRQRNEHLSLSRGTRSSYRRDLGKSIVQGGGTKVIVLAAIIPQIKTPLIFILQDEENENY